MVYLDLEKLGVAPVGERRIKKLTEITKPYWNLAKIVEKRGKQLNEFVVTFTIIFYIYTFVYLFQMTLHHLFPDVLVSFPLIIVGTTNW